MSKTDSHVPVYRFPNPYAESDSTLNPTYTVSVDGKRAQKRNRTISISNSRAVLAATKKQLRKEVIRRLSPYA